MHFSTIAGWSANPRFWHGCGALAVVNCWIQLIDSCWELKLFIEKKSNSAKYTGYKKEFQSSGGSKIKNPGACGADMTIVLARIGNLLWSSASVPLSSISTCIFRY